MFLRTDGRFRSPDNWRSFNVTPIIDIVFLLIIFFLVVCQFIEAENFPVTVPDGCEFAEYDEEKQGQVTTVTLMKTDEQRSVFAVDSEKIAEPIYADIVEKLAQLLNTRLRNLPPQRRLVTLRIDKDIFFAEAQYALAAVVQSSATHVKLAVLKDKQATP